MKLSLSAPTMIEEWRDIGLSKTAGGYIWKTIV
jgi:hypothetical protein